MSNLNEKDIARYTEAQEANWELDYMKGDCKLMKNDGRWKQVISVDKETGARGWNHVRAMDVPLDSLIREYEELLIELSDKEVEYMDLKEEYNQKEFEIVYLSDINFKELYGSTSEKVRKQHAVNELKEFKDKINSLELSVDWLKRYLPFLREVIKRGISAFYGYNGNT
jgi:hypothetical protein